MKNKMAGGLKSDLFPRVAPPIPEWDAGTPDTVFVPIPEGDGIRIAEGADVLCGELLSEGERSGIPTFASVSGKMKKIGTCTVGGVPHTAAVLENDGEYRLHPSCVPFAPDETKDPEEDRLAFLRAGGITLFGKSLADEIAEHRGKLKRLILDLVDDEPLGGAYASLFAARPDQILYGMKILLLLFRCRKCEIAIGDHAIRVLNAAEEAIGDDPLFEVRPIEARYPTADPAVLPRAMFGKGAVQASAVIPPQTALSVCEWFGDGIPYIRRFVEVGGDLVPVPAIVQVPIGTPLPFLFSRMILPDAEADLFEGKGAMSARAVSPSSAVCGRETEGALAISAEYGNRDAFTAEGGCVGCGKCAAICPRMLEPGRLWKAAAAGRDDLLKKGDLSDCLLCGVCEYVCPMRLPLCEVFAPLLGKSGETDKAVKEGPAAASLPDAPDKKEEKPDAEIQ